MYFVLLGVFSLVGWGISSKLKGKFNHYSKIGIKSGMTGYEVAQAMLAHYNISGIKVVEGKGYLSDHYKPRTKTVSLSPQVFQGRSIASAAVAAH